jgi:hypothetical protein
MTATGTSTSQGSHTPAGAFTLVLNAAVGNAAAKLEQKVAGWAERFDAVAAPEGLTSLADEGIDEATAGGGAKQKAGAEGIKAGLHGKNPVWPAIKGAWQAGTPVVRAAIVAGVASVALLAVLSPVLALVFLLSLLVFAAVHRARAAKR